MGFDCQKAYCTQAVPTFNDLPDHVKTAHEALIPLVGSLAQGHNLEIPLDNDIMSIIDALTTEEIACMSRASYFVGHWHPSLLPRLFDSAKGESWKITNCCDQVLRLRLELPGNIKVHEGKLRVTFSNHYVSIWEEFALATEKNLTAFKECGLPFAEPTLDASAKALAAKLGDMWPDVKTLPDNDLYKQYLALAKEQTRQKIIRNFDIKIASLEKGKIAAQKETDFLLECNELGVPVDNVIHYTHTDTFCFGWRVFMTKTKQKAIAAKLDKMTQYKIEFK